MGKFGCFIPKIMTVKFSLENSSNLGGVQTLKVKVKFVKI